MSAPKLEKADNGFYYIHWLEGRRSKRCSTRCRDLEAAKGFFSKWLSLEHAVDSSEAVTAEAAWLVYQEGHVEKRVIAADRLGFAWNNLKSFFGEKPVSSITQNDVDDYIARRTSGRLGRKAAGPTVRKELSAMMTSWRYAARKKLLKTDEIPDIDLPEGSAPRDRWLTQVEIGRLIAAAEQMRVGKGTSRQGAHTRLSRVERFIWLALHTGARRAAIEELKWEQVDFETNVIHYLPSGRNQTKKKRASVPISEVLRPILERAFQERHENCPWVLDHSGAIRKAFDTVADAAGLPDVTRHDLRHTAATHMARAGVPLWIIAGVLGNTPEIVARVYAKHAPDALRDAVNVMGRPIPSCNEPPASPPPQPGSPAPSPAAHT